MFLNIFPTVAGPFNGAGIPDNLLYIYQISGSQEVRAAIPQPFKEFTRSMGMLILTYKHSCVDYSVKGGTAIGKKPNYVYFEGGDDVNSGKDVCLAMGADRMWVNVWGMGMDDVSTPFDKTFNDAEEHGTSEASRRQVCFTVQPSSTADGLHGGAGRTLQEQTQDLHRSADL